MAGFCGLAGGWTGCGACASGVVLNEIMHHPADDRDDLQFVEVLNAGTNAVDLSAWVLGGGIRFQFTRGTRLEAGACAVVCRDVAVFRACYGTDQPIAGVFTGKLSHPGETLELSDGQGRRVEAVAYGDRSPWPMGADGYGSSLERICPAGSGADPHNWAPSGAQPGAAAGGTPGRRNSTYAASVLPRIADVRFGPARPDQPVTVRALLSDDAGIQTATLRWAVWPGAGENDWTEVPMERRSGDGLAGAYEGSIAAQPEGGLIRFTVRARSISGSERICPAPTEPRSTFCCATVVNTNTAAIPVLHVLSSGAIERPGRARRIRGVLRAGARPPVDQPSRWCGAVIYLAPGGGAVEVFDHVEVLARKGGLKVHFHKDQTLAGMNGINLIFESSPRYVLAEALAYEVYRRAGVLTPAWQHVRLVADNIPVGYHLLVEQPNQGFLRRHNLDNNGNLYKLLWYGEGLIGQHEKKTNPHTGHQDLVDLVGRLHHTAGEAQWDWIQQQFDVDEVIGYYAVNMCIQNWDGFFNNYFAYHDLRPGGKWELIPWDEDKTWGDYDGAEPPYSWYAMPLRYGMKGDSRFRLGFLGGGPFGGEPWWRPPGHLSGPLLANPEFRRRFLSRLRELCDTVFTPEVMGPVIQGLQDRLEPDVLLRAELRGENPEAALKAFRVDIQSFRDQVTGRRAFLLKELGSPS